MKNPGKIEAAGKQRFLNRYWVEILLVSLCFVFYGNTVRNGFNLDDDFVTNNNFMVKGGIKALPEIFSSRYATEGKFNYEYRPLVKATYAIEYEVAGVNPGLSHFINVVLYALGALVLYRFLKKYFAGQGIWFAVIVSILFVIHPVHSEVVASLKNRDGILSFIFFVLTLNYSLEFVKNGKAGDAALAMVSYLAGVLSKMDVLSLLAIVPLTAYYLYEKPWKRTFGMLVLLGMINLFFVFINRVVLEDGFRMMGYYENPLFTNSSPSMILGAVASSSLFYVKMAFIPYPLLFYYGYNQIPVDTFPGLLSILVLTVAVTIVILTIRAIMKKELWGFAAGWFLITISMFLNLAVPVVGIVAERFLLIPTIGTSMLLVIFIYKVIEKRSDYLTIPSIRTTGILSLILLITFGQVYSRNKDWKSFYTLVSHDIRYLENSAKANDLYALSCSQEAFSLQDPVEKKRLINESVRGYERAIQIYPKFISAYNNLGSVHVNMKNDYVAAIPYFTQALKLDTGYVQAKANLAYCYQKTGKIKEAELIYKEVISRDTGRYLNAFFNLGELYFSQGKFEEAISINMRASVLFPNADLPWVTMGNYYLLKGDTLKAVTHWVKALEVYPQNEKLARSLSMYFYSKKDQVRSDFYRNMAESASSIR